MPEEEGETCPHCGGEIGVDGTCTKCGFNENAPPQEAGQEGEGAPLAQEDVYESTGVGVGADADGASDDGTASTVEQSEAGTCPACGSQLDAQGNCAHCAPEGMSQKAYAKADARMDAAIDSVMTRVKLPAKTVLLLEQAAASVSAALKPAPRAPAKLSAGQEDTLKNFYRLSIGGVPEGYVAWKAALAPEDKAKILQQMAKSEEDTPELKTLKV